MNRTTVKRARYTFEDFCVLVKEGQKADLIDGVIYMASPDNIEANRLAMWLGAVMVFYTKKRKLGDVVGHRAAFEIDDANAPEPDLAFVRQDRLHLVEYGRVKGPPDLAVEIVSPESEDRDYTKKRKLYQRAGVPEYWILDEVKCRTTLLRLTPAGRYKEVRPTKGEMHSQVLPGFWVRIAWLWEKPLPDPSEALAEIEARNAGADRPGP
jgi:Uma2 family endonuclease